MVLGFPDASCAAMVLGFPDASCAAIVLGFPDASCAAIVLGFPDASCAAIVLFRDRFRLLLLAAVLSSCFALAKYRRSQMSLHRIYRLLRMLFCDSGQLLDLRCSKSCFVTRISRRIRIIKRP